jgi:hypothetical protein
MSADTPTARAEMYAIVAAALAPFPGLVVKYQGVDSLDPPSGDTDWVRVDIQHEDAGQASLSGPTNGAMRWGRNGFIFVQCFAQLAPTGAAPGDPISIDKAMLYACAVRDAFQGRATDSGVWFRNCNAREIGPDKSWYQANASITFDYDEVK